jgi:hypothetical protein
MMFCRLHSPHPVPSVLPFADEQLEAICSTSDVVTFVENYTIYFGDDEATLFVAYVQESGLLEMATTLFPQSAREARAASVGALKHSFAYNRLLHALAGQDDVNALRLPYLMETEVDLACSLLLTAKGYYKQSAQLLRSALEAVITHAYYSVLGIQYDELCNQHTPPMNDRKRGMLNHLSVFGLLNSVEAEAISTLYKELSAATHSQYRCLSIKFEETLETENFLQLIRHVRAVSTACLSVILSMDQMEVHGVIGPRYAPKVRSGPSPALQQTAAP